MQRSVKLIAKFTAGKTAAQFAADDLLRSAVERQFITIGEAMNQTIRLEPTLATSFAETRRIVNFRNVLVHGYARIVTDTVWGVVEKDLPELDKQLKRVLGDAER